MTEKGCFVLFKGDSCTIYDNKDQSMENAKVKNAASKKISIQWHYIEMTLKAQEYDSWRWHRRLGHFNFQGL